MNFINNILSFLKKKQVIYAIIALFVLGSGFYLLGNKKSNQETITVSHSDFINQVSVSGKVVPSESVDLGFSQGGRISRISAQVGDQVSAGKVIASIENGDLQAQLVQKQANLLKEQAKLQSLKDGTRPEQIAITQSDVASAQNSFAQARSALINTFNDAYTKSDDAVKNKIDQFFQNPLTNSPTIVINSNDPETISKINLDRVSIGKMLTSWQKSLTQITPDSDLGIYITQIQANLNQMKMFLAEVSLITNSTSSSYNGAVIPSNWRSDTSTARLGVDSAISDLANSVTAYQSSQNDLTTKQNNLKLEQAGSTVSDIEAQLASVKAATADVENAQALLDRTMILAPFSGQVTKMDAKVGEIASPNTSLISMMSANTFQIESYVPEVSIAQIKLGDEAKVTLDAYGDGVVFDAKVISIDPAETIRDGVSTYKTKLQFSQKDDRIKSGMTANVSITIFSKPNVIVIPGGVVYDKNGEKFVQVLSNNKIVEKQIVVGSVSSLGQDEVVSGLSDGDVVILNPNNT